MRIRRARGLTLVELLLAVALLSILAILALPGFGPGEAKILDAAAAEVASALRFARSEAMRTGASVGVSVDAANERLSVGTYSNSTTSVVAMHPVDKKTYVIDLKTLPIGGPVDIASASFAPGPTSLVVFDASGTARVFDSATTTVALTAGSVVLSHAGRQASVAIDPNGRVTLP